MKYNNQEVDINDVIGKIKLNTTILNTAASQFYLQEIVDRRYSYTLRTGTTNIVKGKFPNMSLLDNLCNKMIEDIDLVKKEYVDGTYNGDKLYVDEAYLFTVCKEAQNAITEFHTNVSLIDKFYKYEED